MKGTLIAIKYILLTLPVIIFVAVDGTLFAKPINVLGVTVLGMIALGIVGIGVLTEKKAGACVWILMLGVGMMSMANIAMVIGICFIIEGVALTINALAINPVLKKIKIAELKASGESVNYTVEIN